MLNGDQTTNLVIVAVGLLTVIFWALILQKWRR